MPRIYHLGPEPLATRTLAPVHTGGLEPPHWPGWYIELVEDEHWLGPYGSSLEAEAALRIVLSRHAEPALASRALLRAHGLLAPLLAVLVVLVVLLAATPAAAAADDAGRKQLRALRVATGPVVDGVLDDHAWSAAAAADDFVQVLPEEGAAPSEATVVRVVYDARAIYVGARMQDGDPEGIVARLARRDRDVEADWLGLAFDSRHDHATAYVFQVNAANAQLDALRFDDTDIRLEWDAVWESQVRVDARGWTAEVRIPIEALGFHPGGDTWGFQAARYISRKKEKLDWAWSPSTAGGKVSRYGHLVGMAELAGSRAAEARPYLAGRAATEAGGAPRWELDAGADFRLALPRELTLEAALNPDFGQVEVDEVILNLSRFEVGLPEKRPFFLEGVDVFSAPYQVFYSRRVGGVRAPLVPGQTLQVDGVPLTVVRGPAASRVLGAAKLTGRPAPGWSFGVLSAVTGGEEAELVSALGEPRTVTVASPAHFGVVRVRRSSRAGDHVGASFTGLSRLGTDNRVAASDHDAYVGSLDGRWSTRDRGWVVTGQTLASWRVGGPDAPVYRPDGTRLAPGDLGAGALLRVERGAGQLVAAATLETLSPHLHVEDVGFMDAFDLHRASLALGYRDPVARPGTRLTQAVLSARAQVDYRGVPTDAAAGLALGLHLPGHDLLALTVEAVPPGTWDPRETLDGALYQRPAAVRSSLQLDGDTRRAVAVAARLAAERSFEAGDRLLQLGGELRLAGHVTRRLELVATFKATRTRDALRFVACEGAAGQGCRGDTGARVYHFARQGSDVASLTVTGMYALTPALTVQAYTQVLAASGHHAGYRDAAVTGARPYLERAALAPAASFAGDLDGDGVKDDDFARRVWNANLLLRWELRPGSTLYVVYTRVQGDGAAQDLAVAKLTWLWN